jgi:hypothetical protein
MESASVQSGEAIELVMDTSLMLFRTVYILGYLVEVTQGGHIQQPFSHSQPTSAIECGTILGH